MASSRTPGGGTMAAAEAAAAVGVSVADTLVPRKRWCRQHGGAGCRLGGRMNNTYTNADSVSIWGRYLDLAQAACTDLYDDWSRIACLIAPASRCDQHPWVPYVLSAVTTCIACVTVYHYTQKSPVRFVYKNTSWNRSVLRHLNMLHRPFLPTPWLFHAHFQTLGGMLFGSPIKPPYRRENLVLSDGGTLYVDWLDGPPGKPVLPQSAPLVVVNHGLTGDSDDSYLVRLALCLADAGYRACMWNARGRGKAPTSTAKMFCIACTGDFRALIDHVSSSYPDSPMYAIGFSMGGNVLAKYLTESGSNTPFACAMTFCMPLDIRKCVHEIHYKPFQHYVYERYLLGNLKEIISTNTQTWQQNLTLDLDAVHKTTSLWDFDRKLTIRTHGYASCRAYYSDAGVDGRLHKIRIPMLALYAWDDPLVDNDCYRPEVQAEFHHNPFLMLGVTKRGGHLGWLEGWWPSRRKGWADKVILEYLSAIQHEYGRRRLSLRRVKRHHVHTPSAASSARGINRHSLWDSGSECTPRVDAAQTDALLSQAAIKVTQSAPRPDMSRASAATSPTPARQAQQCDTSSTGSTQDQRDARLIDRTQSMQTLMSPPSALTTLSASPDSGEDDATTSPESAASPGLAVEAVGAVASLHRSMQSEMQLLRAELAQIRADAASAAAAASKQVSTAATAPVHATASSVNESPSLLTRAAPIAGAVAAGFAVALLLGRWLPRHRRPGR